MTIMDPSGTIPVRALGFVAGAAWVGGSETSPDLHVVGKLSLGLDPQGRALVMEAQPPGRHFGMAAPEELQTEAGRKLLVRGARSLGGRVHLRKGERELAELSFAAGNEIVSIPMLDGAKTGMGPVDGDDWVVVEGVDDPQARRWCMLPRVGVRASYGPGPEQLVLARKLVIVDVQSWIVSLVFRGARPIPLRPGTGPDLPESIRLEIETPKEAGASGPGLSPAVTASLHDVAASARPAMPFRAAATPVPAPAPVAMSPRNSTGTAELVTPKPPFIPRDVPPASAPPPAPVVPASALPVVPLVPPPLAVPAPSVAPPPVVEPASDAPPPVDVRAEVKRRLARGAPLIGLDLRGAHLEGLSFRSANLLGLNLARARLNGADLSGADLRGACLDEAVLDGAMLEGALLANATLERASIKNASLRYAGAAHCVASNANMDGCNLRASDWSHAKLIGARMTRSLGQEMKADGADLSGADMSLSQLDAASLRGASLRGANLHNTRLKDADLADADLREIQGERSLKLAKTEGAQR